VPVRKIIPNLLTTISLCSGLASVHYSLKAGTLATKASMMTDGVLKSATSSEAEQYWKTALLAIGVAAVFDMLDGRAARLLKASSRFGAVLDSLSDFLSFGVAPAILLHQWLLRNHGALGMGAVLTFVLCSALRLARFTAMPKQKPTRAALGRFFVGLPTPAAGGAVLIPAMLDVSKYFPFQTGKVSETIVQVFEQLEPSMVVVYTFLIAGLMVSRLPMFSFKKVRVRRAAVVPLMVAFGITVLAMWRDPWMTISIICALYLLSAPLAYRSRLAVVAHIETLESDERLLARGA
jgi:CDP-diacylglycerol--serine O-phosphatidyltransferase